MELLAMAMPGSFTTEWDVDEWDSVWKVTRSEKNKNRMDPCSQVLAYDRPSPRVRNYRQSHSPSHSCTVVRICTLGRSSSDTMSLKSGPRPSIHQSTSATVQGENIAQACAMWLTWILVPASTAVSSPVRSGGGSVRGYASRLHHCLYTMTMRSLACLETSRRYTQSRKDTRVNDGLGRSYVICWTCLSITPATSLCRHLHIMPLQPLN
jgi:hypothetical protein